MAKRRSYPTDLTDRQWAIVEPLIPPAEPGGRHREVDMREVVDGILYLVRGGISWRLMPHDLPPWGAVHYYYWRFRRDGTWKKIHDAIRIKVREKAKRQAAPSAALLDSQSVKTTKKGGLAEAMTLANM